MARAGTREKRSSEAGQDLTTSSTECPLLPATELLKPPLLTTPSQPALSSFSSSPPQRKVRRAKKRRSPGDLAKRRHRLISFHLSHTPPSPLANWSQINPHWSTVVGVDPWVHLGQTVHQPQAGRHPCSIWVSARTKWTCGRQ